MARALVDGADVIWQVKCREEDMAQRVPPLGNLLGSHTAQAVDNERRCIDDARRNVDEKAEQLKVPQSCLEPLHPTMTRQFHIYLPSLLDLRW